MDPWDLFAPDRWVLYRVTLHPTKSLQWFVLLMKLRYNCMDKASVKSLSHWKFVIR